LDKQKKIEETLIFLENNFTTPTKETNAILKELDQGKITDKVTLKALLGRKSANLKTLEHFAPQTKEFNEELKELILIETKYHNYIKKQKDQIERMKRAINIKIPKDFDFKKVKGLSNEIIEKFEKFNPPTLFAASQIQGVTPAAIDILHIYIKMDQKALSK
jgi:tRNA uridine 5-carboxymethylaminomethyl modification enzyme